MGHQHPGHDATRFKNFRQLLNHRSEIRNAIESTQIREDGIKRCALYVFQRKKRTLLPSSHDHCNPSSCTFSCKRFQHSRRDIRCMDKISTLGELHRVCACACVEFEDTRAAWDISHARVNRLCSASASDAGDPLRTSYIFLRCAKRLPQWCQWGSDSLLLLRRWSCGGFVRHMWHVKPLFGEEAS